ncbi:hypothetical protein [Acetobacter papayae]|nr:hypothetical protein [Acetobacter papayae]
MGFFGMACAWFGGSAVAAHVRGPDRAMAEWPEAPPEAGLCGCRQAGFS